MNRKPLTLLILIFSTLILSSCTHMPQLFWPIQEGNDQSQGATASAPSRQPLVVPPNLRGEVSVPMPDKVASDQTAQSAQAEAKEKAAVAGTAVALDTRVYNQGIPEVFSSVVDAMTELNMPVQSVDSPSGTITTDWIHRDANSPSLFSAVTNIFGAGPTYERYRFVIRVLRLTTPSGVKTQLEVRTLGQTFTNSHWVNKPVKQKVSNELFDAVAEQLGRRATTAPAGTPASATTTTPATTAAPTGASAAPASSQ